MVELVFLMLILKLPIVYLVAVVWYAVRAEPRPPEPALVTPPPEPGPEPRRPRDVQPRPRRRGPHGRPARRPLGLPRAAVARAERRS